MDRVVSFLVRRFLLPGLILAALAIAANAQTVTFVGDYSHMTVGTIRQVRLYMQGGNSNQTYIFLVEAKSNGELTNGLGFSFNMFNGPYEQQFVVRVETDSFGIGYSEQFYMKSLASVSPLTIKACAGIAPLICNSINIGSPPVNDPTVNPPPTVKSIGVGDIVQYWLVTPQPVEPAFRGYTVRFSISPNNSVGVARSSSSSTWGASIGVDMFIGPDGHGRSETFYLKGRKLSTNTVYLPANTDNHFIADSQAIPMRVAQVASVSWVPLVTTHPIDKNHNTGGGRRHFADRNHVTETQESNWRNVGVQVKITPAIANMVVRVKLFDVDDPATSAIIDPNGVAGGDNRETVPSYTANLTTDSTGSATGSVRLSSRPGDNYRLAATVTGIAMGASHPLRQKMDTITTFDLDSTRLRVAGGEVIAEIAPEVNDEFVSSAMMTIWRRLNLEMDRLAPVNGNYASGSFASAAVGANNPFTTTLTLDTLSKSFDIDRFKDGLLELREAPNAAPTSYQVFSNTARTVTIVGLPPNIGYAHDMFVMYDDDDIFQDDVGSLDGDQGEHLPSIRTGLILGETYDETVNVFAPAYIEIRYLHGESNVTFKANRTPDINDFDYAAYANDPTFWVHYLLNAYQEDAAYDGDPMEEHLRVSRIIDDRAIILYDEVYTESERKFVAGGGTLPADATRDRLTAHLLARAMGAEVGQGGLMDWILECTDCETLSPASLAAIRNKLNP